MEDNSSRQQSNGEVLAGGAYGPSNMYDTHEPLGEEHFVGLFTTDKSRTNGRQVKPSR